MSEHDILSTFCSDEFELKDLPERSVGKHQNSNHLRCTPYIKTSSEQRAQEEPVTFACSRKLDYFLKNNKVPHIIFHGASGTGKKTIVHNFIRKIYHNNPQKIKANVMFVNCSHGKGIKFIRDELKFFAKTNICISKPNERSCMKDVHLNSQAKGEPQPHNIQTDDETSSERSIDKLENRRTFEERESVENSPECNEGEFNGLTETESKSSLNLLERSVDKLKEDGNGVLFKTIVLLNADYLTIDAQSALRRCIEVFSYNTRFFIIVENKNKLLCPILSRFCEIYIPEPEISENAKIYPEQIIGEYSLHKRHLNMNPSFIEYKNKKVEDLRSILNEFFVSFPIYQNESHINKKSPECNEGEINGLMETESKSTLNLSKRSVDNSPSLHSGEFSIAYHFPSQAPENGFSPPLRSGENLHSSNVRQFSNFSTDSRSANVRRFSKFTAVGEGKFKRVPEQSAEHDMNRCRKFMKLSKELYEKGFSCLDVIEQVENGYIVKNEEDRLKILMHFYKIKGEYRNEKLLMFYIFNAIIHPDFFENPDFPSFY